MNDDHNKPSMNDMSKILGRAELPAEVKRFAPPDQRSAMAQTPLQIIASSLKRLIWDDNEHMAATVCKHLDNGNQINGPVMAKAIQAAADELLKEHDERA